jgi:hypothetical protein
MGSVRTTHPWGKLLQRLERSVSFRAFAQYVKGDSDTLPVLDNLLWGALATLKDENLKVSVGKYGLRLGRDGRVEMIAATFSKLGVPGPMCPLDGARKAASVRALQLHFLHMKQFCEAQEPEDQYTLFKSFLDALDVLSVEVLRGNEQAGNDLRFLRLLFSLPSGPVEKIRNEAKLKVSMGLADAVEMGKSTIRVRTFARTWKVTERLYESANNISNSHKDISQLVGKAKWVKTQLDSALISLSY